MSLKSSTDILIAGGGYVGLGLALALRKFDPGLAVTVVDTKSPDAPEHDERSSAIARAARLLLTQLGVWSDIEPQAQAIEDMVVTDSKLSDLVRPVILTFAEKSSSDRPFAHMVPNGAMVDALRAAALTAGADLLAPNQVVDFQSRAAANDAVLRDGTQISCQVLIAADGVGSSLRELAGIKSVRFDYPQTGIVTTVAHSRPHEGRAEEHFLPSGPFAILPLKGNRSSIVWTEQRSEAERMIRDDRFVFQLELERRFGRHLGEIEIVGSIQSFPLGLMLARDFVAERFALAGDAAHGIHPISGQGLNMGFRDIAALTQVLVEARRLGQDIGSAMVLANYQRWRRFDTYQMGLVTDGLNRLFSNDISAIRFARDLGLGIVDRLPRLKALLINEAKGAAGNAPRLLRGEPV